MSREQQMSHKEIAETAGYIGQYGAGVYILVIEIAARIFAEELGSGCRPRAASCLYEFVMKPIFLPYEIKNVKYTLDASLLRVLFF